MNQWKYDGFWNCMILQGNAEWKKLREQKIQKYKNDLRQAQNLLERYMLFGSKSLMKPIREQSRLGIHTVIGNLKDESMCDVVLNKQSKQSFVQTVMQILFGTGDEDVWNIVNGLSRPARGPKKLLAGRVRGFLFDKIEGKQEFMRTLGHGHKFGSDFKHALYTKKLTLAQRKERDKWLSANEGTSDANNYYSAVEGVKNVFKYDLLQEKACK
jgi:hypothetical protein